MSPEIFFSETRACAATPLSVEQEYLERAAEECEKKLAPALDGRGRRGRGNFTSALETWRSLSQRNLPASLIDSSETVTIGKREMNARELLCQLAMIGLALQKIPNAEKFLEIKNGEVELADEFTWQEASHLISLFLPNDDGQIEIIVSNLNRQATAAKDVISACLEG